MSIEDEYEIIDDEFGDDHASYNYDERQAKPLAEQSLNDFDDYFQRHCRLNYVFLISGYINTVYPDVASAIRLVDCSLRGINYKPFEVEYRSRHIDEDGLQKILSEVRARVEEMNRRGEEYCLIWTLPVDGEVHVDGSENMVTGDQFASFLAEEVREHVLGP